MLNGLTVTSKIYLRHQGKNNITEDFKYKNIKAVDFFIKSLKREKKKSDFLLKQVETKLKELKQKEKFQTPVPLFFHILQKSSGRNKLNRMLNV